MKTSLGYASLFVAIQAINLPLMLLGIPIVGVSLLLNREPPWLWNNSDDPVYVEHGTLREKWEAFVWLALRNPVANLRLVPGVSKSGRPLLYSTKVILGKEFYYKIGWESGPPYYPVCSAGAGRGY